MVAQGIKGIPDGTVLTAERELWETGLEQENVRVHFASYGDSIFEIILYELNTFELPGCIRRLSVQVPGLDGAEMVGAAFFFKVSSTIITASP